MNRYNVLILIAEIKIMNNPETINPKLVNPDPKGSLTTKLARNTINPITKPIIASISLCLKVSSLTLNTNV